ncbi:hypothetical protein LJB71_08425 [Thermomonas sp. S9]|uniref:Eco57I restriction-modification methylase domain-containing protein n=1 Tax=Thermomonas sp. S9 TaxID=2885203 RepID=UPI00216B0C9D|nr:hypothetical protein [Thermomonas sp. S9]MCR6496240.1 hypothetical protein [Thermomonas sp. S9]
MSNFFDRPELKRNFFDDAPEPVRPAPTQTPQPKLTRSWGETAKDLGLGVAQGTGYLLGGTAELANTLTGGRIDKGVRKAQGAVDHLVNGGEYREGPGITGAYTDLNKQFDAAKSPLLQRRNQELADTKGFFASAKKILTDPVVLSDQVAQQVPQLASMAGTARGTLVKGAEKALAKGATREAAEAAGRKSLERQIVAYSAVQEAGPSAMQARQEIDQLPQSVWDSNEEYRSRIAAGEDPAAVKESMSNVAALKAAGVGGAAGALGGKLTAGLEGRIFTRGLDHAPLLSRQGAKELASTMGKEALDETIQEGGNQLGTNVGVQGIDETRGLMEGVPEAAGTGAALGGLIGGGLHVAGTATSPQLTRGPQPVAEEQPAPDGSPDFGTAPITVAPDGTAATLSQDVAQSRARSQMGLTPDVNAARAAHPGAAPNTIPLSRGPSVPFPDAAPGSLSDALNATAESAAPPAQVSDPDGLAPLAQRAGAAPLGSLADAVKDVPAAPLASSSVAGVPADGAQAEDLTSARAGEDSRSQTMSREQFTLGEESGISEELARGASNDARSQQDTGVQNLAERGGPVPEPEQSVAPQLRGPGNQAASAVGAELSGVPEGSGQASGAGVYAGADRQQQRLPAGQRTVGDAQGTGEQPAKNAPADLPRKNPVADGVGGGTGPGAVNAAVPSESGRDVGGAGIVDAAPRGQEADGPSAVATAAMEAATSPDNSLKPPSPAQVEAGNFKVGRTRINGLDISIEHPAGVKRKAEHSRALAHAYGYIRRTEGADGEKFDVFLGHRAHDATLPVFVVDQNRADGSFDESKALMGFASNSEARAAYLANYPKGWGGLGAITQMTQDEFKAWVKDPAKTALPAAAPRSAEPGTAEQEAPGADIEDEIRPAGKKRDRGFTSAASVTAAITERGLSPADYEVKATEQGGYIGKRKGSPSDSAASAPAKDSRVDSVPTDARARTEGVQKDGAAAAPVAPLTEDEWNALTPAGRREAMAKAGLKGIPTRIEHSHLKDALRNALAGPVREILRREQEPVRTTTKEHDPFAGNTIFTSDAVEKARARLKAKLGTLNSGVDPEMLVDGATIAGAYIESGVRKFGDYAKAMVADLGEAIKPYLLSFYEGVRHYPGFDAKGMDSAADAQREFDALLTPADLQADAIGNAKPPRKTRVKATTERGARTLRDDWGVDHINGYSNTSSREDGNDTKDAFLKDASAYLKAVAEALEDQGYTVTLDRKGKPAKAVSVNEGGMAGSGDVFLHMVAPDGTGIYVHVGDTALRGVVNTTTSGIALMYRTTDGTHGKSGANQWGRVDLTAAELAAELVQHVERNPWTARAEKGGVPHQSSPDERRATAQDQAHNVPEEAPNVRRETDFQRNREGTVRRGEPQSGAAEDRNDDAATHLGAAQPRETAQAGAEWRIDPAVDAGVPERAGSGERDARAERAPDSDRVPAGGRSTPVAVIPKSNFTITDELDFSGVGAVGKFNGNLAAIRLLKTLEAEGRRATPEEQAVLARYVGWGGLPQAFRHPTSGKVAKGWDARVAELEQALTPEELAAAARSTQDAHYTSAQVVRAIWRAVDILGFTHGRVLEPSMGTGNFFGLMPQQARTVSALTGVELDSITGRIARQLYQSANVQVRGFNDIKIAPESFDLAIGNPPFGSQSIHDPQYPDLSKWSIHNYFFAKSIASLRPGGVLAMVVSSSFLDANTSTTRAWIAERARLLGAIRLPQTAFQQNAGTNVTTDIVFLQRLADGMEGDAQEWVSVGTASDQGQEFPLNRYFLSNPDMMLGRMVWSPHTTIGRAGAVLEANPGEDLAVALDAAVAKLPAGVYVPPEKPAKKVATEVKKAAEAAAAVKVYGYFVAEDGSLRQRQPDKDGEHTDVALNAGAAVDKRIRAMIPVRDAVRDLLAAELSDASDAVIEAKRKELNRVYDAFVKANGRISRDVNKRALRDDPDFPLLLSLERDYDKGVTRDAAKKAGVEPRAESAKKADIFTKRTNYPVKPVTSVSDAKSAMLASLNERGRIDLDYMAELYAGKDRDAIVAELGDLVFRTPEGTVEPADAYLSGNVKAKLAAAREAAKDDPGMLRNVAALEKVQPQDVDAADIFVQIGTPWIPASDYADFVRETIEGKFDGRHVPALGKWLVDVQSGNRTLNKERWGTERMGADAILEAILTDKPIVVKDKGANRDDPPVVNKAETAAALGKASELQTQFVEWLWKDASRRERLMRFYNDTFNTDVRRKYDGAHMTFPGMSRGVLTGGKLRPHQAAFAYRMVQDGVALADHVVGAGKTYAAIAGTMEMRRLGLWRKPMIVVPNHLVDQWASDFLKLYPGANVLAAGRKDFEKSNRRKLFGRIATGDWDAVIVAHSSFGFIPVPAEAEARILRTEIKEIEDALDAIRAESGKKDLSFKQLQKRKEGLEAKLKKLNERTRDDLLDFAEMGVDALVVDEAHEFKNLFFVTSKRNVAGLGSPEGSKKAFDLYVKTRMLAERDGGKNRVFLTGTPVSNTLSEVYHMQRYLQRETLEERGVASFDAWASVFGQIVSDWEMDAAGRFKEKTRFRKFANLPELVSIWRQVADTVTRADLIRDAEAQGQRFPLPKIKGGKPQNIVVPRSPQQAAYIGIPTPVLDEEGKQMHDPETGSRWRPIPRGRSSTAWTTCPRTPALTITSRRRATRARQAWTTGWWIRPRRTSRSPRPTRRCAVSWSCGKRTTPAAARSSCSVTCPCLHRHAARRPRPRRPSNPPGSSGATACWSTSPA